MEYYSVICPQGIGVVLAVLVVIGCLVVHIQTTPGALLHRGDLVISIIESSFRSGYALTVAVLIYVCTARSSKSLYVSRSHIQSVQSINTCMHSHK